MGSVYSITTPNHVSPKLLFIQPTALHGLYSGLFDWKEITVSAKESTTSTTDSKVLGDTIERKNYTDTLQKTSWVPCKMIVILYN